MLNYGVLVSTKAILYTTAPLFSNRQYQNQLGGKKLKFPLRHFARVENSIHLYFFSESNFAFIAYLFKDYLNFSWKRISREPTSLKMFELPPLVGDPVLILEKNS